MHVRRGDSHLAGRWMPTLDTYLQAAETMRAKCICAPNPTSSCRVRASSFPFGLSADCMSECDGLEKRGSLKSDAWSRYGVSTIFLATDDTDTARQCQALTIFNCSSLPVRFRVSTTHNVPEACRESGSR